MTGRKSDRGREEGVVEGKNEGKELMGSVQPWWKKR